MFYTLKFGVGGSALTSHDWVRCCCCNSTIVTTVTRHEYVSTVTPVSTPTVIKNK